jgi:polysaccharide chain length determinant protein (PEP-CTERM system associated)
MIDEAGTESPLIPQLLAIALRRKWLIVVPFVLSIIVTLYLCVVLPPIYRSETTILVEPQQVPEDYVQSTVTGSVRDRLSTISQQILSRTRLESVIRDLDLYPDMRARYPMEDVVRKMRENIEIDVEEGTGRSHRGEASAAAFRLAFLDKDPHVAQKVTSTLANLYIEENLRVRETLARGTKEFLDREVHDVEQELAAREEAIREFRQKYMGELPEQLETNLRTLDQLQEQKNAVLETLRESEDRLILLERQLDHTPASLSEMGADQEDLYATLEQKRQRLSALTSRYTELYPDVITLKKEIRELEERIAGTKETAGETPTEDSPVVEESPVVSANPAYQRLTSQIESDRLTVKNLRLEIASINQRMRQLQRRVENIPSREQELMSLKRDYETIKQSYDSLMERKINAAIAENLETRQKSERFRILDPANFPQKPVKPNRRKILAIGLVLGLGLGGGLAFLREQMDDTFHSVEEVKAFVDIPVIGVIPLAVSPQQIRRKKLIVATVTTVSLVSVAALVVGVHVYVKKIDVLVTDLVKMFLA